MTRAAATDRVLARITYSITSLTDTPPLSALLMKSRAKVWAFWASCLEVEEPSARRSMVPAATRRRMGSNTEATLPPRLCSISELEDATKCSRKVAKVESERRANTAARTSLGVEPAGRTMLSIVATRALITERLYCAGSKKAGSLPRKTFDISLKLLATLIATSLPSTELPCSTQLQSCARLRCCKNVSSNPAIASSHLLKSSRETLLLSRSICSASTMRAHRSTGPN
mmetsp:Transcript_17211/g.37587  ORF Transcript_17211/g.37587 Transcript_17211/m.37587 type:complete len:229 (+) Transcript_17211:3042-3728(+)